MGFVDDDAWLYNMSLRCVIRIQRKSMNNVYVCVCVWICGDFTQSRPKFVNKADLLGEKKKI